MPLKAAIRYDNYDKIPVYSHYCEPINNLWRACGAALHHALRLDADVGVER